MIAAVDVPPGDRSAAPSADTVTLRRSAPSPAGAVKMVPSIPVRRGSRGCTTLCAASTALSDFHAGAPKLGHLARVDAEAGRLAVDDRVERPRERHVGAQDPRTDLERQAAAQHERRHVHKPP